MGKTDLAQILAALRAELPHLREEYSVQSLQVFGSHVRGEGGPESDIDVLIRFYEPPGLLRFIELEQHLSELLGVQVDLVMESALKPRLGKRILEEAVPV